MHQQLLIGFAAPLSLVDCEYEVFEFGVLEVQPPIFGTWKNALRSGF